MNADAVEAEKKLEKLSRAGTQSWSALMAALTETRTAFDRANEAARELPRHPFVERVVQEQVRQQRRDHPALWRSRLSRTTLPSPICTDAFSQRSM
jgi:hypothetical protein